MWFQVVQFNCNSPWLSLLQANQQWCNLWHSPLLLWTQVRMGKVNLSPPKDFPMHMCLQTQKLNEGITLMVVPLSKVQVLET